MDAGGGVAHALRSKMHPLISLLFRWAVLALGVALASEIVPGIGYDTGRTLVAVVLLLSLLNAIVKPILVLFTLPFILLTLGLGMILINACLFLFVGRLIHGFHVDSFWSAVGGAVIVSLTNLLLTQFGPGRPPRRGLGTPARPKKRDPGVIDV